jgi:hypothetical protein
VQLGRRLEPVPQLLNQEDKRECCAKAGDYGRDVSHLARFLFANALFILIASELASAATRAVSMVSS